MKSYSIRFNVSVVMKVLLQRRHPSADLRNQCIKIAYDAESSFNIGCSRVRHNLEHNSYLPTTSLLIGSDRP